MEIATWIVAGANLALVLIAMFALGWAARHAGITQQTAFANFLLEIDRRWESEHMGRARVVFHDIKKDVEKDLKKNHDHLHGDQRNKKMRELYAEQVLHRRGNDRASYVELMRICGFLETVGYLVRNEYVPLTDIYGLFGGAILGFDDVFRLHLEKIANEEGVPPGYYEHTLFLADAIRKRIPAT